MNNILVLISKPLWILEIIYVMSRAHDDIIVTGIAVEEEERVTSYSTRSESRIFCMKQN